MDLLDCVVLGIWCELVDESQQVAVVCYVIFRSCVACGVYIQKCNSTHEASSATKHESEHPRAAFGCHETISVCKK